MDKAFCFVAAADGSSYNQWRFDAASTAVASATVIVPLNPLYTTTPPFNGSGRWIKLPTPGGGGGGSGGLQSGAGDPEGVADAADGQFYWNTDASPTGQSMWANLATSGTTGWFLLFQF